MPTIPLYDTHLTLCCVRQIGDAAVLEALTAAEARKPPSAHSTPGWNPCWENGPSKKQKAHALTQIAKTKNSSMSADDSDNVAVVVPGKQSSSSVGSLATSTTSAAASTVMEEEGAGLGEVGSGAGAAAAAVGRKKAKRRERRGGDGGGGAMKQFDMSQYRSRHVALQIMYDGRQYSGFASQAVDDQGYDTKEATEQLDGTVEKHLAIALAKV